MDMNERKTINLSVHFTESDLELIKTAMVYVYGDCDIKHLIRYGDRSLGRALTALDRITESTLYKKDLTVDDRKHIDSLSDICCAFVLRFPDDENVDNLNELWLSLIKVSSAFSMEI